MLLVQSGISKQGCKSILPIRRVQFTNTKMIIIPIIRAPCKDRKELNKVETEQIIYYSKLYGDRLLNKQSVPKNTNKIYEYKQVVSKMGVFGQFLYIWVIYALFGRFRTVFIYLADICTFWAV